MEKPSISRSSSRLCTCLTVSDVESVELFVLKRKPNNLPVVLATAKHKKWLDAYGITMAVGATAGESHLDGAIRDFRRYLGKQWLNIGNYSRKVGGSGCLQYPTSATLPFRIRFHLDVDLISFLICINVGSQYPPPPRPCPAMHIWKYSRAVR
jgi:hypothetical protein